MFLCFLFGCPISEAFYDMSVEAAGTLPYCSYWSKFTATVVHMWRNTHIEAYRLWVGVSAMECLINGDIIWYYSLKLMADPPDMFVLSWSPGLWACCTDCHCKAVAPVSQLDEETALISYTLIISVRPYSPPALHLDFLSFEMMPRLYHKKTIAAPNPWINQLLLEVQLRRPLMRAHKTTQCHGNSVVDSFLVWNDR